MACVIPGRVAALVAVLFLSDTAIAQSTAKPVEVGFAQIQLPSERWSATPIAGGALIRPGDDPVWIWLKELPDAEPLAALRQVAAAQCPYPILSEVKGPGDKGFDETSTLRFDVPPSANRYAFGSTFQKDGRRIGLIGCGDAAAMDRLLAETGKLSASLQAKGWAPEDFTKRTPNRWTPDKVALVRNWLSSNMTKLRVPGAAFALVDNGRIVAEEGLGVRQIGHPEKVDAHTRFMIASNTKGLTTLLLAKLVSQGKVGWDTKVSDIDPAIRMADPESSRQLTVRHLICACTGLPRADYESFFVEPTASSKWVIDELGRLKPTTEFGKTFQYSNTLAAIAGIVAGRIAHPDMEPLAGYSRAMKDMVFTPLGMNDTDFADPRTMTGNVAQGYGDTLDGIGPVPQGLNATLLPYRSTGSGVSSVHDMALYVMSELSEGKTTDGRQWIDRRTMLDRRAHGVSTGKDSWYGMGLRTRKQGGVEYLFHGGDVNGYHSQWIAIPGTGLGAVLLTSGENGVQMTGFFPRRMMEIIYGGEEKADKGLAASAAVLEADLATARKTLLPVGDRLNSLARHYRHPILGDIRVRGDGTAVTFDFGVWNSPVAVKADPGALGGFTYVTSGASTVEALAFVPGRESDGTRTLTLSDAQHKYVYREVR